MRNSCSSALLALVLFSLPAQAAEAPSILARKEWQAKSPTLPMTKQKPIAILVHHTGSKMKLKTALAAKMRGLQRFSQAEEKLADGRVKPAWPDVPYHFYIGADGAIAEGRDVNAVGDTNTGYNPNGFIQVVVEGNFDSEKVTAAQEASLKSLLAWLKQKYAVKNSSVLAHSDKAQTACPGKDLAARLPAILKELN
jgi:hypothetical protein